MPGRIRSALAAASLIAGAALVPCFAAQPQSAGAAGYPAKPIRFLVGNAPGGGIDITARAVGQKLTERWGKSVVVDNRPGASGMIALDVTTQAAPDGYTLLVTSGSLIASAGAQKKLAYDVRKAFVPVTQLTSLVYMLLVNANLPVASVKDLVAHGRAKPGALAFGSSGVGGIGHLAGELFANKAGIKVVHVPYKGGGLVLADLISGQIQFGFTSTIAGMPHVRGGRLKGLGVTGLKRATAFPELPTIDESGLPGFELVNWYGLFGPAGTPQAIVGALHGEIRAALRTPEVQSAFAKDGAEATASAAPAAFATLLAREIENWSRFITMPGFAESLR